MVYNRQSTEHKLLFSLAMISLGFITLIGNYKYYDGNSMEYTQGILYGHNIEKSKIYMNNYISEYYNLYLLYKLPNNEKCSIRTVSNEYNLENIYYSIDEYDYGKYYRVYIDYSIYDDYNKCKTCILPKDLHSRKLPYIGGIIMLIGSIDFIFNIIKFLAN